MMSDIYEWTTYHSVKNNYALKLSRTKCSLVYKIFANEKVSKTNILIAPEVWAVSAELGSLWVVVGEMIALVAVETLIDVEECGDGSGVVMVVLLSSSGVGSSVIGVATVGNCAAIGQFSQDSSGSTIGLNDDEKLFERKRERALIKGKGWNIAFVAMHDSFQ